MDDMEIIDDDFYSEIIALANEIKEKDDDARPEEQGCQELRRSRYENIQIRRKQSASGRVHDAEGKRLLPIAPHGVPEVGPDENRLARSDIAQEISGPRVDASERKERQAGQGVKDVINRARRKRLDRNALKAEKSQFIRRHFPFNRKNAGRVLKEVRRGTKIGELEQAGQIGDEKEDRKVAEHHKNVDRNDLSEIVAQGHPEALHPRLESGNIFADAFADALTVEEAEYLFLFRFQGRSPRFFLLF